MDSEEWQVVLQVAVFLALWRLVYLCLTSIIALSRLDRCLFTVFKGADRGYASFLAMALMLHSFQVQTPPPPCSADMLAVLTEQ
jgi:hypothetical protein